MLRHRADPNGIQKLILMSQRVPPWSLAGGRRSTRFEPASQCSQLPTLRIRGLPSKPPFDDCVSCQVEDAFSNVIYWGQSFRKGAPIRRIVHLSVVEAPMQIHAMSSPSRVHSLLFSPHCRIQYGCSML